MMQQLEMEFVITYKSPRCMLSRTNVVKRDWEYVLGYELKSVIQIGAHESVESIPKARRVISI